ncbi:MAG TPA: LamG domain-containing protein, partial [Polyangiaceae bacterium]|nr:LamG domain-containing protein [Polyangiaceae bacterium]
GASAGAGGGQSSQNGGGGSGGGGAAAGGAGGGQSGGAGSSGSAGSGQGGGAMPALLDGCILLLNMEEPDWSAGAGAVRDASGAENHGNAINAITTSPDGKFGRAGQFDGTGWVEVPNSASLGQSFPALTYAAWVYPTEVAPVGAGIFSKRKAYLDQSAFTLFLYDTSQAYTDVVTARLHSKTNLGLNQWHHVAVVYDGGRPEPTARTSIYVDGILDLDAPVPAGAEIGANAQDLLIGNLIGGGGTFVGRIDEVAIWARALGEPEIAALYNASGPLSPAGRSRELERKPAQALPGRFGSPRRLSPPSPEAQARFLPSVGRRRALC